MNSKEYNNIIEGTLKTQTAQTEDSLAATRAVLTNMGVALPQGDLQQVSETLATDDYMGWRKCTVKEAQEYANSGTAVVGVSDDQIVVVAAETEAGEADAGADSASVMTLSESTSALAVSDTVFYANSSGGTCSGNDSGIHFDDTYVIREVGWKGNITLCGADGLTVLWWSSDLNVATIDRVTGRITAVGEGDTTISVTTSDCGSASFILHVDSLTIYQTQKTFYLDENYNVAGDLKCGDLTEETMPDCLDQYYDNLNSRAVSDLLSTWVGFCKSTSTGNMQTVLLDMVDYFMEGNTSDYRNDSLTNEVKKASVVETYVNKVQQFFTELLAEYNGDVSPLKYFPGDTSLDKDDNVIRKNVPMVRKLSDAGVGEPSFGVMYLLTGLMMAVHGFWGHIISVKSFNLIGNNYSGALTFKFYDHFGLDTQDIKKYSSIEGFRAWYFLQHHEKFNHAYRPFTTVMEFNINFSGTLQ